MRAYSPTFKAKVVKAYNSKRLTIRQISERFGVSTATINTWAKVEGLTRGVRTITPAKRKK